MRYKAAIFDLDGTLLDTLEDLADSMNRTLAAHGFPPHLTDRYRFMVGRGMTNLALASVPDGTPESVVQDIRRDMMADYSRNWSVKTKPYMGIPQLLGAMRVRGCRLGVLSNKPDSFTQAMVAHYFPDEMFTGVRGASDAVPIKPDPSGAYLVVKQLGAAPEETLYFGDTNTDMQTGTAAGMYTIGVTWGFRPEEELRKSGAMAIIHNPLEALEILEETE